MRREGKGCHEGRGVLKGMQICLRRAFGSPPLLFADANALNAAASNRLQRMPLIFDYWEGKTMTTTNLKNRVGAIAATVAISCALCVMLAGCATENSGNVTSDQDEHSAAEKATITTRTVTFPAALFKDESSEDVQSSLQEKGCTDIIANDDGSYTATMPIDAYNSFVDSWHQNVVDALDGMPNSEDWPTITAIDYDDQFSNVTLTISSSEIGLKEAFAPLQVGVIACMYQQFAGQPVSCVVSIVDQSGAELGSATYPDALDEDRSDAVSAN